MAYDLYRYVSEEDPAPEKKDARARLQELIDARIRAGAHASNEEERIVRELEQDQARNWGNDAMGGATVGFMASGGNPWGALAGGIAGTAKGMARAYEDRKKSGQSDFEAGWRTLFDFRRSIPDIGTATPAAAMAYNVQSARDRRGQSGRLDPYGRLQSLAGGAQPIQHGNMDMPPPAAEETLSAEALLEAMRMRGGGMAPQR